MAANTCGNPTVCAGWFEWPHLVIPDVENNGNDSQTEYPKLSPAPDVRKIYSCYSDDNGATWSARQIVLLKFSRPVLAGMRTGPGCGYPDGEWSSRPAHNSGQQSEYLQRQSRATWTQSADLPGGSERIAGVGNCRGVLLRNDRASGGNAAYKARVFLPEQQSKARPGARWRSRRPHLSCLSGQHHCGESPRNRS